MIERSYGRWMPKGVDRGVRSLRALPSNTAMFDARTGPQVKQAMGDGLTHGSGAGIESGPTGNRMGSNEHHDDLDELIEVLVDSVLSVLLDNGGTDVEIAPFDAPNRAKTGTGSRAPETTRGRGTYCRRS